MKDRVFKDINELFETLSGKKVKHCSFVNVEYIIMVNLINDRLYLKIKNQGCDILINKDFDLFINPIESNELTGWTFINETLPEQRLLSKNSNVLVVQFRA